MRSVRAKGSHTASCDHGIPCNIPASYTISPATLDRVKQVMSEDISATVVVFKALSDPIRLRILKTLHIADLCVCVLVELLDCEYSKLSYHLRLLKEAGLIDSQQDGNFLIYRLTQFGDQTIDVLCGLDATVIERDKGMRNRD